MAQMLISDADEFDFFVKALDNGKWAQWQSCPPSVVMMVLQEWATVADWHIDDIEGIISVKFKDGTQTHMVWRNVQ